MSNYLELISKARDMKPIPLDMRNEWGCEVFIKKWSWDEKRQVETLLNEYTDKSDEREALSAKIKKAKEENDEDFRLTKAERELLLLFKSDLPRIAFFSLCDEQGNRICTEPAHLEILKARSPESVEKVVDEAFKHNGLGEAAKKNSKDAQVRALFSDSPCVVVNP